MPSDVHALIAGARLPERTVPICLRGNLVAQVEALDRELAELDRPGRIVADSLAGDGRRPIAERIEALREEMRASTVNFLLRALPRRRWNALLAEHPPREGDDGDKAMGVNSETLFEALIAESVVSPELTPEEWTLLLDSLSSAQYDSLATAAWALNRRGVDVPFSPAASRILASSASE